MKKINFDEYIVEFINIEERWSAKQHFFIDAEIKTSEVIMKEIIKEISQYHATFDVNILIKSIKKTTKLR